MTIMSALLTVAMVTLVCATAAPALRARAAARRLRSMRTVSPFTVCGRVRPVWAAPRENAVGSAAVCFVVFEAEGLNPADV